MLTNILLIIAGLLLLIKGGDYLVDGAVAIAQHAKLSSMVIGLTVVGFGTSMPELLVSAQSALDENPGIAIGNVVGSNISNIALILGLTALIHPIPAQRSTLRIDMPFMLLASFAFVALAILTGTIGRVSGIIFLAALILFVSWQVRQSRKQAETFEKPKMRLWKAILLALFAFAMLVFGADILVEGASEIAIALGVSYHMIGLTIVAVGTSLPELFASVMAARKGETDMAIGNIIGSITFNILCVIGVSAAIEPIHNASEGFIPSYALMIILGLLLWLFLRTRHLLERWEGMVLLMLYIAFLFYTVMFDKAQTSVSL